MNTEKIKDLCRRCKGRYLRIDYNTGSTNKILLIYNPDIEIMSNGAVWIESKNTYEINRYMPEKISSGAYITTQIEKARVYCLKFKEGMRVHKTPYNIKTVKELIKKILL